MKPITVKTAIAAAAAAFALCAAANDRAAAARNAYKLEAALQETRQLAEQFDVLSRNQEILDTRLSNLEKASGAGAGLQVQIDELRSAQESLREAISALARAQQAQRREIVEEITRKVEALYRSAPPPAAARSGGAPARPARQVPTKAWAHVVAKGQTLVLIAREYGCTVQDILDANPGLDPKHLKIGQTIDVPDMSSVDTGTKPKKR